MLRAIQTYERWLMAPLMERLAMESEVPFEFEQGLWTRIERRGALAVLKALAESIKVRAGGNEVHGTDCKFMCNFPYFLAWRLGERTAKHLPNGVGEWVIVTFLKLRM